MTILVHPDLRIPPELSFQYERVLANLAAHSLSHGLNIELLRSRARVYSVRINHKARLLIAPCRDEQGQSSWVALECLDDHKYESVYLRINQDELEQRILAIRGGQPFSTPPTQAASAAAAVVVPPELTFYQNMIIQLTTEQDEVVTAGLPLVVNGVAGSGKTCVGLSTLRQAALAWEAGSPPIVYVTMSPRLVGQMKRHYQQTYGADAHVLFLTYQQVLEQVLSGSFEGFVSDDALSKWLGDYIQRQKHLSKSPDYSIEVLCREFRQVCVFNECAHYLEIGARHSLLSDEDKKWVFTAYQAYRAHLAAHKQVHPDLYHEPVKPLFSLVVADESQDLGPAALETLNQLVYRDQHHAPQIMYLADANQSLENGNLLVLHHLIRQVGEAKVKTLPVSHRSPTAVIEVANRLLTLRNSLLGGVYDKYTQSSLTQHGGSQYQGEVRWVDSVQPEWAVLSDTPDFAVITSPAYLEEAKERFNTPLVFTSAQIKGLEYKFIVVYRFLEGEQIKAINDTLRKEGVKSCSNRARRDELTQEQVLHVIYLNKVFTAFTRALQTLIIFQAKAHQNKEVITFLNPAEVRLSEKKEVEPPQQAAAYNSAAWRNELARQESEGNQEVALKIREKLEKLSAVPQSDAASAIVRTEKKEEGVRPSAPPAQAVSKAPNILPSMPLVPKNKDVMSPLSKKLTDYVEVFLKVMMCGLNIELNVLSFLESGRADAMLLVHVMQNGKTLLENLISKNSYANFKTCIKRADLRVKYAAMLQAAIEHPQTSMGVLVSILISDWDAYRKPILQRWLQNEEEKTQCLLGLVIATGDITFVEMHWSYLQCLLTPKALSEPSQAGTDHGVNLFYVLTSTTDGLQFLKKKWADIKPCLTVEGLNRVAEAGEDKGKSPFYWLAGTSTGRQLLKEKGDEIWPLVKKEGFNRPAEVAEERGLSSFWWLAAAPDGRQLLKEQWNQIQPVLTKEALNQPAEVGDDKGKTPFWMLASNADGRQLLREKWREFQPLLTKEGFNSVAEAGKSRGINTLFWLTCRPDGLQVLKEKWGEIQPLLTKEALNRPAETEEERGKTPLWLLAGNAFGRQLLKEKWSEIYPLLTKESLNRAAETVKEKGVSPLWCFAAFSFKIEEKWNDILPLLTEEGFNRPVETEEHKGVSPFWLLAVHVTLLKEKWSEIRLLLTKNGLNRAAEVGEAKGMTPLYLLASNAEGRQLLEDNWKDIQPLLSVEELIRIKTFAANNPIVSSWIDGLVKKMSLGSSSGDARLRFHTPALPQDTPSSNLVALS